MEELYEELYLDLFVYGSYFLRVNSEGNIERVPPHRVLLNDVQGHIIDESKRLRHRG